MSRHRGGSLRSSNDWNNRFHVAGSKDNRQVHEYFREFFDKPNKRRQERMFEMRSDIDALKAEMRLPTHSKVWQPRNLSTEYGWDRNFVVMGSKNNGQVHRSYREYFDRPI